MFIDLKPGQRRYVLGACIATLFTAAIEGTIVATAMPTIVTDLGGFALFSWVFAAYMLTQAVTIPIYGRLADLYGRKKIIFIGLALFVAGSTLCGFAQSMLALVLFRALQGVGAGAVLPVTMTIVGDIYPPVERIRIQPYLAGVFAISSIIGPVVGAFIVNNLGWPLIFWLNVPICVISFVMLYIFLHEHPRVIKHAIDGIGAVLLMVAISLLLLPLLQAEELRWWILPLVLMSAATFALFLRQERRSPEPLLPAMLWRDPMILACNLGSFAIGANIMAVSAFLPTYLQSVMGMRVINSGIVLAVMSLSWPVCSVFGSRLALRTSYRTTALLGGVIYAIGGLLLPLTALLSHDRAIPVLGIWWSAVVASLIGAGMGICNSSLQVATQESSGVRLRGAATAAYNFMRMLGATFGTAILGAVLNLSLAVRLPKAADPVLSLMDAQKRAGLSGEELHRLTGAVTGAMHDVFWTASLIALGGFAAARMTPRGHRPGHVHQPETGL